MNLESLRPLQKPDDCKPAMVVNGEPWWLYLFTYRFEDDDYTFEILARSEIEARERLKKIALARYEGQAHGRPVMLSHGGFLLPLMAWWRNYWK